MEERKIEGIEVGGHNVFPSAESAKEASSMWSLDDFKDFKLDGDKTVEDLVKEVAETEGMSEEEVLRHLQAFSKIMEKTSLTPKTKTNKQKAKDKSKRKMAKKSKKKNR